MKKILLHNVWNILREREAALQDFLQKAEGQLKGIDESICVYQSQIEEEEINLKE